MNLTHKSPNFTKGRGIQKAPIGIVIHISEGSLNSMTYWFQDSNSGVSAHYGIGRDGEVRSFVKEENTAWHAGRVNKPVWRYMPAINPNIVTVGIEHAGFHNIGWTIKQKEASAILITEICKRWNIPANDDTIIGHWQIDAVRRANCPATNKDQRGVVRELVELTRKKLYGT